MRRWPALASVVLATAGCVASKGDIRLLQDEMRATRAMIAHADSLAMQRDQARRADLVSMAASIARASDSLRVLSQRLASFQAMTSGQLDQVVRDVIQTQAMLGQSARTLEQMRAQYEALREQAPAPIPPSGADTSQRAAPAGPGPVTLWLTGRNQYNARSYTTARASFEQLLSAYPNAQEAAGAQLYVGMSYEAERNQAAADSVYQPVVAKYPASPYAPTALYKRGRMLWDANKRAEARPIFQRLIQQYPRSDEAGLARDLIGRG